MSVSGQNEGPSRFTITDHANSEMDGRAIIFGQCDEPSIHLVSAIRRTLQATDDHPAMPFVINHITIVSKGTSLPQLPPPTASSSLTSVAPLHLPQSGPEPTGRTVHLDTTAGMISCRLFEKESPVATATFLGLVDGSKSWTDPRTGSVQHHHPFYNGMPIDRVLPDFYIQFGDITGDISGNPDIGFHFKNEHYPGLSFDRPGRLAFGNGGPDTNSSELFFSLNPMHSLDSGFPIIGQCDAASLDVLAKIAAFPRDGDNRPTPPIVIRRISVGQ